MSDTNRLSLCRSPRLSGANIGRGKAELRIRLSVYSTSTFSLSMLPSLNIDDFPAMKKKRRKKRGRVEGFGEAVF